MNLSLVASITAVASVGMFIPLYYIMSTVTGKSISKRIAFLLSAGISVSFGVTLLTTWTPEIMSIDDVGLTADVLFFIVVLGAYCLVVLSLSVASITQWRQDDTPS